MEWCVTILNLRWHMYLLSFLPSRTGQRQGARLFPCSSEAPHIWLRDSARRPILFVKGSCEKGPWKGTGKEEQGRETKWVVQPWVMTSSTQLVSGNIQPMPMRLGSSQKKYSTDKSWCNSQLSCEHLLPLCVDRVEKEWHPFFHRWHWWVGSHECWDLVVLSDSSPLMNVLVWSTCHGWCWQRCFWTNVACCPAVYFSFIFGDEEGLSLDAFRFLSAWEDTELLLELLPQCSGRPVLVSCFNVCGVD